MKKGLFFVSGGSQNAKQLFDLRNNIGHDILQRQLPYYGMADTVCTWVGDLIFCLGSQERGSGFAFTEITKKGKVYEQF